MRTIILGHNGSGTGPSISLARYATLQGPGTGVAGWSSTSSSQRSPIPIAGTISNLNVRFPSPITNAGTFTITLRNQSGATALTCTIDSTGTTCESTSTVSVASGDYLEWGCVPSGSPDGTHAQVQISCTFDATTDGESMLLFGSSSTVSNSATNYTGLNTGTGWNATEAIRDVVIPCPGTIDLLEVLAVGSPGAGTSYTITVRKNGADQTLTAAISGTNTANSDVTNSFTVVAGDIISVSCVPSGTPTARGIKGGVRFVPTVNGSTPIMSNGGVPSTTLTRYLNTIGTATNISVESQVAAYLPASCDLKNMYIDFDSAPGAGKSRAFISRIGGANGTVTTSVDDTNTTATPDTTHTDSLVKGDILNLSTTPSGTPGSPGNMRTGFVLYVAPSGGGYTPTPDLRPFYI